MHRIRRATAGMFCGAVLSGLVLAGCQPGGSASPPSSAPAQVTTTSPSPGLSVPGTHKSATVYRISAPVSTVVVIGHVGNITVTGGGPAVSVTQQATWSRTPPVTTRTISGKTLTVTYTCPSQAVCAVAYALQVPRDAAVRAQAAAPGTLAAVAHVGAIILHLPGADAYKVSADARVGHADVGVRQSSASDHVITATTDVGAIKISASA